jgi:hypothetical protein
MQQQFDRNMEILAIQSILSKLTYKSPCVCDRCRERGRLIMRFKTALIVSGCKHQAVNTWHSRASTCGLLEWTVPRDSHVVCLLCRPLVWVRVALMVSRKVPTKTSQSRGRSGRHGHWGTLTNPTAEDILAQLQLANDLGHEGLVLRQGWLRGSIGLSCTTRRGLRPRQAMPHAAQVVPRSA